MKKPNFNLKPTLRLPCELPPGEEKDYRLVFSSFFYLGYVPIIFYGRKWQLIFITDEQWIKDWELSAETISKIRESEKIVSDWIKYFQE